MIRQFRQQKECIPDQENLSTTHPKCSSFIPDQQVALISHLYYRKKCHLSQSS